MPLSAAGDDRLHVRSRIPSRAVLLAVPALLVAVVLSGLWRIELTSAAGRVTIAAYLVAALAVPRTALLILAATLPIAGVLALVLGMSLAPSAFAEALVLCVLLGCVARAARRPFGRIGLAEQAALAVAILAVVSAGVLFPALHAQMADPGSATQAAATLFVRDYFYHPPELRPIHAAALIAESAGLFIVARRMSSDARFRLSLLRMLIAGAAMAAGFNVMRLVTVAARAESFGLALGNGLRSLRINIHHADLNAAGSFFALFLCVAVAFSGMQRGWWASPIAALLALALWLTGSRTAMAALAMAWLGLFLWTAIRGRHTPNRRMAVAAALATALAAAALVLFWPRSAANMAMRPAFTYRLELWRSGLRMIEERPLAGVGIGQFPAVSSRYRPLGLDGAPPFAENAHNNFLQVAAELGLPGFAAFVCWLAFGVAPAVRRLAIRESDRFDAALVAGILAFVLTWLSGHPLLVPLVAFPFWMTLGAAGAGSSAAIERSSTSRWLAAAAAVVLAVSIPSRVAASLREADLEHAGRNLSGWIDGGNGIKYRRAENCSGLFVPAEASIVTVPVRAGETATLPLHVSLTVEGRSVNAFVIDRAGWMPLRFRLPQVQEGGRYRLLEIRVTGAGENACNGTRLDVAKVTALDGAGKRIQ